MDMTGGNGTFDNLKKKVLNGLTLKCMDMRRLRDARYYCDQHLKMATTKANVDALTDRLKEIDDSIDEGMMRR